MSEILAWIRQMIYLVIFLTLLLQILPSGSYRKYVKFFAGIVFVITVASPLAHLFGTQDAQQELLSRLLEGEKQREAELDFPYMESRQQEYYEKSVEAAVREIAVQAAGDAGTGLADIEVDSSPEDGTIRSVTVWAEEGNDADLAGLKRLLAQRLGLNDSQLEVIGE